MDDIQANREAIRAANPAIVIGSPVNGAGIDRQKLTLSTGRPKGARNIHGKHPSSLARRLKTHGIDWVEHFAAAIKGADNRDMPLSSRNRARENVRMWLRLVPYLVTTTNTVKVKKWKGKASKAAIAALDALEGR